MLELIDDGNVAHQHDGIVNMMASKFERILGIKEPRKVRNAEKFHSHGMNFCAIARRPLQIDGFDLLAFPCLERMAHFMH